MRELRQKQLIKKRLYSTPALVGFALVTLFLIHGAYGVVMKDWESSQKVDDLNIKLQNLTDRQTELKDSIQSLQTDEGIDKEIKEKFSVSRDGEHVVVIVDPKPIATTTDLYDTPWYKRLWDSIIGN
jgi:cell division protein FtsB